MMMTKRKAPPILLFMSDGVMTMTGVIDQLIDDDSNDVNKQTNLLALKADDDAFTTQQLK